LSTNNDYKPTLFGNETALELVDKLVDQLNNNWQAFKEQM